MRRVVIAALLALWAASAEAADLCVKSGGNDSTAKASLSYVAGNEAGSTCWATLGRAVWGNASRSSPNASEAAAAGDTVYIFGGTYNSSVSLGGREFTVYNTANDGTSGNPIVFRCMGVCTLTAPTAEAVLLGQGDNYIEWRADIASGYYFDVPVCSESPTSSDCPASGVATAQADYPPIACVGATGLVIEGFHITGVQPITYLENWNGLRAEACQSSTFRNVRIRDITYISGGNHNRSCITIYHSSNNLFEHIDCQNTSSGFFFKDSATSSPQTVGNTLRYSVFDDVGECFVWSLLNPASNSGANYLYQNVCKNSTYAVRFVGDNDDGSHSDVIANNLFYNMSMIGIGWAQTSGVSGTRIYNNIFLNTATAIGADASVTWPVDTVIDLEHNVYYGYSTFYTGSDGNRTFASFNSTYSTAHDDTPTAIITDPLVVDVVNGDYRLCTGSGTPAAGCSGASPAAALGVDVLDLDGDASTTDNIPAGVYVTGSEVIGLNVSGGGGGATAPEAPTIGTATAGNAQCVVTFTPNGTGGSPITSYTATSSPGSITGTGSASPITVTGLTNGQAYTFTVTATNAEGTSSASSASGSCTPAAPAGGGTRLRLRGGAVQQGADGSWSFVLEPEPEDPRGVPFACRVTGLITVYANGDIGPRVRCETGGALLPIGTAFTIPRQQ